MQHKTAKLRKIASFAFAGGLNTAFGLLIYAGLVFFEFPIWVTVTLSMVGSLLFNYLTYGAMVFKDLSWQNFPRFIAFYIFLAGLNTALLHVAASLSFSPFMSQAALTLPLAITSYIGLSTFVFPQPKEPAVRRHEPDL